MPQNRGRHPVIHPATDARPGRGRWTMQPDLWTAAADPHWLVWPQTRIERRFAEFHRQNPHVYAEFERRAMELYRAGARRIGVKAIAERIRWDVHVRVLTEDYKINNSLVALYARLLVHRRPELTEVIELRRRKEAA